MLEVTALKKSFLSPEGTRVDIVHVPEFRLTAGEQVALRGESGSGKTTFLHLIAGILAADAGRVTIDGTEMTALSEAGRDRLRAENAALRSEVQLWEQRAREMLGAGQTLSEGIDLADKLLRSECK